MPTLLTYPELREHGVLYTRGYLAKLEAAGKFPLRVHLGEARIAWVEQEINAWIAAKIKARKNSITQPRRTGV